MVAIGAIVRPVIGARIIALAPPGAAVGAAHAHAPAHIGDVLGEAGVVDGRGNARCMMVDSA